MERKATIAGQPGQSSARLRWWFRLVPEVFVLPLMAALLGGVWAVFLLRTEQITAGLIALLVWLTYLVIAVSFVTRRKYVSFGFAVAVPLIGVAIAASFAFA